MRRQDELLKLIQSLTPSEKRYFKLFSSVQLGGKKYFALFDELAAMESYDAAIICKKLKTTKPRLANDKKYLEKMVVRALRSFNEKNSPETRVQNALCEIELLYNKEQFDMCRAIIDEAKTECIEYELFNQLLQFLIWEKTIDGKLLSVGERLNKNEAIWKLEKEWIEKLENFCQYRLLSRKTFALTHSMGAFSEIKYRKELEALLKNTLLKDNNHIKSFRAAMIYYGMKSEALYALQLKDESLQHVISWQQHIEQKPWFIRQNADMYVYILTASATRYIEYGEYDKALGMIEKLEQIPKMKGINLTDKVKRGVLRHIGEAKMTCYAYGGKYDLGISFFRESLPQFLKDKEIWSSRFFTIYYYGAAFCFFQDGDYSTTLKNLRVLIDDMNRQKYDNWMTYAYMLHIMTHAELGNYETIPYLLKSLKQFTKKLKFQPNALLLFIKFFNDLSHQRGKAKTEVIFKNYQPRFTELTKNDNDRNLLWCVGFNDWMKKKTDKPKVR